MCSSKHFFNLLCMFLLLRSVASQIEIQTSSGPVSGSLRDLDGEKYREFLGIPYAEQPIRFSQPEPKLSWIVTFDAVQYGPSCPQDVTQMEEIYDGRDYLFDVPESAKTISEDCLTLNIFTPDESNPRDDEKYAVMVWIHGGQFRVGQGAAYNGAALATRGRVIVVTFNYRLGPFGLLSTLDQDATGNYAFLDQQLALQWIQRDIHRFSGDPGRVTLFGQSTGGISASLHLFAPGSQELFHRVIAESSVTTPWNLEDGFRDPVKVAREFAKNAGCGDFESNSDLVNCLRESDLDELMKAWRVMKQHPWRITWGPVLDGDFLPVPSDSESSSDAYTVMDHDLLVGMNTLEGSPKQISVVNGINEQLTSGLSMRSWITMIDSILSDYSDHKDLAALSVNQLYTDWDTHDVDDLARLQQAVNLVGDLNSVVKVYDFLTSWTSDAPSNAFMYVFDHRTEFGDPGDGLSGAPRSEELPYVWGLPFRSGFTGYFTADEMELSDTVIMYWTNFAKSGNPNQNPDQPAAANAINDLPSWPKYTNDQMSYIYLSTSNGTNGNGNITPRERYRWQYVYFWTETLPSLIEYNVCQCRLGENEGWNLTPDEAIWLLNFLIGLCIFWVVVVMMTCAMACGYGEAVKMARYGNPKGKWGYLPKNSSVSSLRREKSDIWKQNHAFELEVEEDNTHL